jgi:hypothetical protein
VRRRPSDPPLPSRIVAKLGVEKKGRGGKTVTVVYDLPSNEAFLKDLGAGLKRECSTGGAVTEAASSRSDARPSARHPPGSVDEKRPR